MVTATLINLSIQKLIKYCHSRPVQVQHISFITHFWKKNTLCLISWNESGERWRKMFLKIIWCSINMNIENYVDVYYDEKVSRRAYEGPANYFIPLKLQQFPSRTFVTAGNCVSWGKPGEVWPQNEQEIWA